MNRFLILLNIFLLIIFTGCGPVTKPYVVETPTSYELNGIIIENDTSNNSSPNKSITNNFVFKIEGVLPETGAQKINLTDNTYNETINFRPSFIKIYSNEAIVGSIALDQGSSEDAENIEFKQKIELKLSNSNINSINYSSMKVYKRQDSIKRKILVGKSLNNEILFDHVKSTDLNIISMSGRDLNDNIEIKRAKINEIINEQYLELILKPDIEKIYSKIEDILFNNYLKENIPSINFYDFSFNLPVYIDLNLNQFDINNDENINLEIITTMRNNISLKDGPQNIQILELSDSQCKISWDTMENIIGYKIYFSDDSYEIITENKHILNISKDVDKTVFISGFNNSSESYKTEFIISNIINFSDTILESGIRNALSKPEGPILFSELKDIKSLTFKQTSIDNLEGIQYCSNLEELDLSLTEGSLWKIEPLKNLKKLRKLNLSTRLNSEHNNLTQIKFNTSPKLALPPNYCLYDRDFSFISDLINLEELNLFDNGIKDISFLKKLTNLKTLNLGENYITDITPLKNLTKLTNLNLYNNSIADINILSYLPLLEELNIEHYVNPFATNDPNSKIISISSLEHLINLKNLYLCNNEIEDISILSNLSNLTYLDLSYNRIININSLKNLNNLSFLNLTKNNIENINPLYENSGLNDSDKVFILGNNIQVSDCIEFSNIKGCSIVYFPDESLNYCITNQLSKPIEEVTLEDLKNLKKLNATHAQSYFSDYKGWSTNVSILDLCGIELCYNIETLNLYCNNIKDLNPISNLKNLKEIDLTNNSNNSSDFLDLSFITNLLNLEKINLNHNNIDDFSPLLNNSGIGEGDEINLYKYKIKHPIEIVNQLKDKGCIITEY